MPATVADTRKRYLRIVTSTAATAEAITRQAKTSTTGHNLTVTLHWNGRDELRHARRTYPSPVGYLDRSTLILYSPPPLPSGRVGSTRVPSVCTVPVRSTMENLVADIHTPAIQKTNSSESLPTTPDLFTSST